MTSLVDRIPLQIVEGRLVLTSVIECKQLRIHRQVMRFILDTGSPNSYFSYKDVIKLQIPLAGKNPSGQTDFGGSRFDQIPLPKVTMYILKEGKQSKDYYTVNVSMSALRTTKTSQKNIKVAEQLPSILGIDFLKEQKFSLHLILTEDLAYLQYEG